jgi:hypothetical protein
MTSGGRRDFPSGGVSSYPQTRPDGRITVIGPSRPDRVAHKASTANSSPGKSRFVLDKPGLRFIACVVRSR